MRLNNIESKYAIACVPGLLEKSLHNSNFSAGFVGIEIEVIHGREIFSLFNFV